MALAGMAAADTATTPDELTWDLLSITTPANGELGSGNSAIDWSEDTGNLTNSWELSLTLAPSRVSNQYLFGTVNAGSGAQGYTLQITDEGAIRLASRLDTNTSVELLNVGSYTADDSAVAITLQFVKFVDSKGEFKSGVFTLTVGDAVGTYTVDSIDNTTFTKGSNNNVWTNGGAEKLSGISLKYAGAVVVPEPTTATLSLLALAGLAARRRRASR